MTNSQRLAKVRTHLFRWITDQESLGSENAEAIDPAAEPTIVRESILIRDEFYCGRRFHTERYQAVWFIEEDELKIYDQRGKLLAVLSADQIDLEVNPADQTAAPVVSADEDGKQQGAHMAPAVLKLSVPDNEASSPGTSVRRAA